jgi:hypothetical protein
VVSWLFWSRCLPGVPLSSFTSSMVPGKQMSCPTAGANAEFDFVQPVLFGVGFDPVQGSFAFLGGNLQVIGKEE